MSRTVSVVRRCRSSAPPALPQAAAYPLARSSQAFSSWWVVGTYGGRLYPAYVLSQLSDGLLAPTPRGSKPIQSYAAPAAFGTNEPITASPRPAPPGPPGLTSMTPWYLLSGTVCFTRET